jgi:hypothetical protein
MVLSRATTLPVSLWYGGITVSRASYQWAPRVADAWTSCRPMASIFIRIDLTMRGKPTTADAITSDFQVKKKDA